MESVRPFGRLILVGNPVSDMSVPRDVYWRILRNQLTISGSWNSTFLNGDFSMTNPDDWHYILNRLQRGTLSPERLITHRLPLSALDQGLRIMKDRSGSRGKIMLTQATIKQ